MDTYGALAETVLWGRFHHRAIICYKNSFGAGIRLIYNVVFDRKEIPRL